MYSDKISGTAKELLALLNGKLPPNTYLAGGTGLALHLGHRSSFDLDLYSPEEFDEERLITRLESEIAGFKTTKKDWQTIVATYKDTEFSIFHYPYELLEVLSDYDGTPVASIVDIAAMKLEAISGRGLKRDFYDIYKICELTDNSLPQIITDSDKKYNREGSHLPHLYNSLVYFEDAEKLTERATEVDAEWDEVKQFFIRETKDILES